MKTKLKTITLQQAVRQNIKLNEKHINSLHDLLTKGMRSRQRINAICRVDYYNLDRLAGEWFASRIEFSEDGQCRYFAGQDYVYEINLIRDFIVKNY